MVKIDENYVHEWIYKIISELSDDPDKARDELMKLSSFILNAPQLSNNTNLPKTRI